MGAVGNGTFTNVLFPAQIGNDTNWQSISDGRYHARAIKDDGSLWCWGYNTSGQVGDGTTITQNLLIPVGLDTAWLHTSGGDGHTIALSEAGTLFAWGRNNLGQLGDGTVVNNIIPTQIGSTCNLGNQEFLTNAISIYPNPTSGTVRISSDDLSHDHISIQVINKLGQVLASFTKSQVDLDISLTSYPVGIYYIKIKNLQTETIHKVIKK